MKISDGALWYPVPIIDLRRGPGEGMALGSVALRPALGWVLREESLRYPGGQRGEGTVGRHPCGLVAMISADREEDGHDWLHVSISRPDEMPTYADLVLAKDGLIGTHREAYQIFARREKHVNVYPFCLHLWSPLNHRPLPDFARGNAMI